MRFARRPGPRRPCEDRCAPRRSRSRGRDRSRSRSSTCSFAFAEEATKRVHGAEQLKVVDQRRVAGYHVVARKAGLVQRDGFGEPNEVSSAQPNAVMVTDITSSIRELDRGLTGRDVGDHHRSVVRSRRGSHRPHRSAVTLFESSRSRTTNPTSPLHRASPTAGTYRAGTAARRRTRSRRTAPGTRVVGRPHSTERRAPARSPAAQPLMS